jgi:hypothetical protein
MLMTHLVADEDQMALDFVRIFFSSYHTNMRLTGNSGDSFPT